jgi:hypothetical protein
LSRSRILVHAIGVSLDDGKQILQPLREKASDGPLEQATHLQPIFSNHLLKYAALTPHLFISERCHFAAAARTYVYMYTQARARALVDRGKDREMEEGGERREERQERDGWSPYYF